MFGRSAGFGIEMEGPAGRGEPGDTSIEGAGSKEDGGFKELRLG
jgi:hypothetical protein